MVFFTSIFACIVGLALGIVLVTTKEGGILENKVLNSILDKFINLLRVVPFIIILAVVAPLGIYSNKIKDVSELKEGDKIAIPDDVSNQARAIFLLQTAGLIKVDGKPGDPVTLKNIIGNSKNLKIIPMDASQTARALDDVAAYQSDDTEEVIKKESKGSSIAAWK